MIEKPNGQWPSNSLPDPLVPPEVNLRDFPYMPLECGRLRRSKQWLVAKRRPEIGFYSINLWTAAWHEVPAGSIEDDDDVLADAAMCAPEKWDAVKAEVMRGWVKCSDGRLYHPVVCEKAAEAFECKKRQRARTAAAREAYLAKHPNERVTQPVTALLQSPREGKGRDIGKEETLPYVDPLSNNSPKEVSARSGNGSGKTRRKELETEFDQFWKATPNKVGKAAALPAFIKARGRVGLGVMLAGLARYVRTKPPDQKWCNPTTWLNQERWLDEPAPASGKRTSDSW